MKTTYLRISLCIPIRSTQCSNGLEIHSTTSVYSPKVAKARGDHTISFIRMPLDFDHGFIKRGQWYHKTLSTRYTVV